MMLKNHVTLLILAIVVLCTGSVVMAADRSDTVRTVFTVEGMHCDGCTATITGTLERMDGVLSAQADHEAGSAEAVYNSNKVKPEQLKEAIEKLGYTVTAMETGPAEDR